MYRESMKGGMVDRY